MFEKWFGKRVSRPSARRYSFRPQLEHLEGRLTPSAIMPMAPGPGGPPGPPPPGHGPPGPPPPGHGPPGPPGPPPGPVHINAHDSFNTTITGSFNTAVNNITVNEYFGFGASQQAGELALFQAAQQDFGALIGLAADEIELAEATIFSIEGGLSGMSGNLAGIMHNLQSGIQSNPLEGTSAGQIAGSFIFNSAINQAVNVNNSPGAITIVNG